MTSKEIYKELEKNSIPEKPFSMKDILDKLKEFEDEQNKLGHVCPTCGRCPTCGHNHKKWVREWNYDPEPYHVPYFNWKPNYRN
jgi:hypothetical protein